MKKILAITGALAVVTLGVSCSGSQSPAQPATSTLTQTQISDPVAQIGNEQYVRVAAIQITKAQKWEHRVMVLGNSGGGLSTNDWAETVNQWLARAEADNWELVSVATVANGTKLTAFFKRPK